MITIDIVPTDRLLATRIVLAQAIERLVEEQEQITILISKEQATEEQIDRSDDIGNKHLPNAINAFRLHMEGSGACSRWYNNAHPSLLQTIALDFLRTIQMVEQDIWINDQRAQ